MAPFRLEEISLVHESALLDNKLFLNGHSKVITDDLSTSARFRKFVKESEKQRLDWRPGPNKTSITRYLMFDAQSETSGESNSDIRALALLRFPLDSVSELDGGNIICEVPSTMRNKGLGSMCLALMLFEAVRAGLRRVLVTCSASDGAARRVIEKNRGQLQDVVNSTDAHGGEVARYWIRFT